MELRRVSLQVTMVTDYLKTSVKVKVVDSLVSFIEPLEDQTVQEKSDAIFTCRVNRPDVNVKWLRLVTSALHYVKNVNLF